MPPRLATTLVCPLTFAVLMTSAELTVNGPNFAVIHEVQLEGARPWPTLSLNP